MTPEERAERIVFARDLTIGDGRIIAAAIREAVEEEREAKLAVVEAARCLANLASSSATILSLDLEVDDLCDAVRAYDATTSPTPKPPRS